MPERTRGASPATNPNNLAPEMRQRVESRLRGLRLGATCFALLGGLALYFFLTQKHAAGVVAVGVGLVYAVLVRLAVMSLARDWLLRAAARVTEREREG
ncbi:MAG: hypothetical protein ACRDHE_07710 [Ktedonobacterales bacterium]